VKRILLPFAVLASLACLVALNGCSGGDDSTSAPTKTEIDKGLEGKPAIDPNSSAPMGSKGG
jgi:predicted component of type VI protein secretion system